EAASDFRVLGGVFLSELLNCLDAEVFEIILERFDEACGQLIESARLGRLWFLSFHFLPQMYFNISSVSCERFVLAVSSPPCRSSGIGCLSAAIGNSKALTNPIEYERISGCGSI